MRRQRTTHVQRWSCVMSLVPDIILRVAIFKYWYDSSRTKWEEGLKFYLGTTVAWPIGDVACDNTDSIFTPGSISCFVYPSTNRTLLLQERTGHMIWGHSWKKSTFTTVTLLTFLQIVAFSFCVSAMLNSQAGYRCALVPRLPFPVPRSAFFVLRYQF